MAITVWLALLTIFAFGGLTPGPAVMLVTTSSMRYGFAPAMLPALGICVANIIWVGLAASGVAVLAHAFPLGFLAIKIVGVGYIFWLAWQMAFAGPVDLTRRAPPPRRDLFIRGIGLQLANPNALVFFGGLMPAYFDPDRSLVVQSLIIMATVSITEMFGLVVYAAGANWLAKHFASPAFARWFSRFAALAMAGSAVFAVYSTWASTGR
jgi:threonine/homoserine/homoserine lactone efflux protein